MVFNRHLLLGWIHVVDYGVYSEVWSVLNGEEWDLRTLFVFDLPFWLVGGFCWGLGMHIWMNREGEEELLNPYTPSWFVGCVEERNPITRTFWYKSTSMNEET